MSSPSIDITYAAHTTSCTFLLDSEGICRRVVMKPKGKRREASRTAARCVGAQYVASLDGSAAGGLVEMPRVGAAMLFARVDERGRVSLVRTGVVTAFESQAAEDPFIDSRSVETSAPELAPPPPPLAPARAPAPAPARTARALDEDLEEEELDDPDYYDPCDRTQRIQALRPEEIAASLGHDLATSEYRAASEAPARRSSLPPKGGPAATLRNPHRDATVEGDDNYARSAHSFPPAPTSSRGMLPRRIEPPAQAAAARAVAGAPRIVPRAQASDIQIARRRRGS